MRSPYLLHSNSSSRSLTGISLMGLWLLLIAGGAAHAQTDPLGTAVQYAVLGYDGSQVSLSGGGVYNPITGMTGTYVKGNFGVAASGSYQMSAGMVQGTGMLGTGATFSQSGGSTITGGTVQNSSANAAVSQALTDATNGASKIAAMTATQTFNSITHGKTIKGNGGTNVIDINSIDLTNAANGALTISGKSTDKFYINVANRLSLTGGTSILLSGGVLSNNVYFNIASAAEHVTINGKSSLYGSILDVNQGGSAVNQNDFVDLSGGYVYGDVIGGKVSLTSSSQVCSPYYFPGPAVPEDPALTLLGFSMLPPCIMLLRKRFVKPAKPASPPHRA